jgi:phosphonoacetaldehyde hydrolase
MTTPIRLVVADLAGTTIDFGSCAPAGVFVDLFARHGIPITVAEARGPMGTAKRDHIAALAALPRVAVAWATVHGRPFAESDLDELYAEFIPLQLESLPRFDALIPGTLEAVAALRQAGLAVAEQLGCVRRPRPRCTRSASARTRRRSPSCCTGLRCRR